MSDTGAAHRFGAAVWVVLVFVSSLFALLSPVKFWMGERDFDWSVADTVSDTSFVAAFGVTCFCLGFVNSTHGLPIWIEILIAICMELVSVSWLVTIPNMHGGSTVYVLLGQLPILGNICAQIVVRRMRRSWVAMRKRQEENEWLRNENELLAKAIRGDNRETAMGMVSPTVLLSSSRWGDTCSSSTDMTLNRPAHSDVEDGSTLYQRATSYDGQGVLQRIDDGPAYERHTCSDSAQDRKRKQKQQARASFASSVTTDLEAACHARAGYLNQLVANTATHMHRQTVRQNGLCGTTDAVSRPALTANLKKLVLERKRPGLVLTIPARDGVVNRPAALKQSHTSLLGAVFDHDSLPRVLMDARVSTAALQLEFGIIGTGCFGEVRLASLRREGAPPKRVAVKILHRFRIKPLQLDHFKRALQLELLLPYHPSVVRSLCWACCAASARLMVVMEYCTGGTLLAALESRRTCGWGWSRKLLVSRQLADGLAHLHGQEPSVIHRDIKPENLLLDHALNCKIADLGMSRFEVADHTMSHDVGTPLFSAPEQLARRRYNSAADVWAAGCVLICLATDRSCPYDNDGLIADTLCRIAHGNEAELLPSVSTGCVLHSAVHGCCQLDSALRVSAAALAREVGSVLDTLTVAGSHDVAEAAQGECGHQRLRPRSGPSGYC